MLRSIVFAIILSLGLGYVYAWTGPTAPAPGANTLTPINVGASQIKTGGLQVGSLVVDVNATIAGYLNVGTLQLSSVNVAGAACSPNGALSRNASGMALSCASGVWAVTGGGTTPTGLRGIYYPLRGKTISCNSSDTTGSAMVDSNGDIFVRTTVSGWSSGMGYNWNEAKMTHSNPNAPAVWADVNGLHTLNSTSWPGVNCFVPWPAT